MKKNINIQDLKKPIYEIMKEELAGYNVNVYPVTYYEYFNELSSDIKLKLPETIIRNIDGYNDHKGNIVIFLERIYEYKGSLEWKLFCLLENVYHEARHVTQSEFNSYSYDGFVRDMDSAFRNINEEAYYTDYKNFSYEIGANLYGVKKAKEYLQKKFPSIYKKIEKKIALQEDKYNYNYMMYDASKNVGRFVREIRENPNITNTHSIKELCPVLDIFMNSNLTFKSLNEIMKNTKFKELDIKVISAIISCKSFYESINIENLSKEELDLLNNVLNYTHKIYQNQTLYLENALNKKIIDKKTYYYTQRSILNRLKPLAEKEQSIMLMKEKKRGLKH